MTALTRLMVPALLLTATPPAASAQPQSKPLPEPLPMGVPYVYQPGNSSWYAPIVPVYNTPRNVPGSGVYWYAPATYVATTAGYVPVTAPYPFASSGPVFGRYARDYTGFNTGFGWTGAWWPHDPNSFQYPTLSGRVWMGFGW
jgi:hypothetical protein